MRKKIKSINLENIPKTPSGKFNWAESKGSIIKFVYGDLEGELYVVGYKSGRLKVEYSGEIHETNPGHLTKCKIGSIIKEYTNEFKIEIGEIFNDEKRDLVVTDRKIETVIYKNGKKHNYKKYKYKCNKCGFDCGGHYFKNSYNLEYYILEASLLGGNGCPCCCSSSQITVPGINDIPTTDPWMVKYFQGGYDEAKMYTRGSNQYITPICPDCGEIKKKMMGINEINSRKSIGCTCGDGISFPNKFAYNLLKQLEVEFIQEYSPNWIKPKRYDFCMPRINIIIEMDGRLGHGNMVHSKSNKTSEETKLDDIYKDNLANNNGFKVIRIDCLESDMEYIRENILKSELVNYFDFSKVDWLKCERFALSNLSKSVADFWKYKRTIENTLEIANMFGISRGTTIKYLNSWAKLNYIDYDGREENIKHAMPEQPVEVYMNKILIGEFRSLRDLQRKSEEVFGIKLDRSGVTRSCKTGNTYKGYLFKFKSEHSA